MSDRAEALADLTARLMAENDRLRAALQQILSDDVRDWGTAEDIARAALQPAHDSLSVQKRKAVQRGDPLHSVQAHDTDCICGRCVLGVLGRTGQ